LSMKGTRIEMVTVRSSFGIDVVSFGSGAG
jgi:hypothetical protein